MFCSFAATAQTLTPIKFNDHLVQMTLDLEKMGGEWGGKFGEISKGSKNYGELTATRLKMQGYCDKKIGELKAMKDVSGSEEFRKAVIGYLEFEKQLIQRGFVPLEKLSANSSDSDIEKAIKSLMDEAASEETYLLKVHEAQDRYAKKNNFTIETPATETPTN